MQMTFLTFGASTLVVALVSLGSPRYFAFSCLVVLGRRSPMAILQSPSHQMAPGAETSGWKGMTQRTPLYRLFL